eukprot:scaffold73193_cov21-Tisochrysis_lutea.AAC.1
MLPIDRQLTSIVQKQDMAQRCPLTGSQPASCRSRRTWLNGVFQCDCNECERDAGLTKVPIDGQPASIVQELEDMARQYIKGENAIILVRMVQGNPGTSRCTLRGQCCVGSLNSSAGVRRSGSAVWFL